MDLETKATTRRLLTRKDLGAGKLVPNWLRFEYGVFRERLSDPAYPCYFGTASERRGELRYGWVEGEDMGHVPALLREFLALSRSNPNVRHALALFFRPEVVERPLSYYRKRFWDVLRFMHGADASPWPEDRPSDPEDPKWEFCFDGEPMFVFASTPAYETRDSRNMGNSLVLLFQPRRIFDGVEGGTPAGTKAREMIRDRMRDWDGMDYHPDMGTYGDPSSFEWKQYFLPDDNSPVMGGCPFHSGSQGGRDERGTSTPSDLGSVPVGSKPAYASKTEEEIMADEAATPEILRGEDVELRTAVMELLPETGSVEVQRDTPGREHTTHTHPTDETLLIVDGTITFSYADQEATCTSGDRLLLPAGVEHSSVAGEQGYLYIIALETVA